MSTLLSPPLREQSLTTSTVTSGLGLTALRDEWNELAAENPMRQHEWLATWWDNFAEPGDRLAVVTVRDAEGELVGLAPWCIRPHRWLGHRLVFLGADHVATDYATILTAPGHEAEVLDAVAGWLRRREMAWDWLELTGVAGDDPAVIGLAERLRAAKILVRSDPGARTWRLELPATWEAYLMTLSKSRRERVRRLQRQQLDTGRMTRHAATDVASIERGFEILVDLHQKRRVDAGDPGCFADPRFTRFLHDAAAKFLAREQLRLHWLELEGRPISVEIDFVGGGVDYRYQTGIEPSAYSEDPGWLTLMSRIRQAIAEGLTVFDFMRGDEPYKSSWRGQPVSSLEVRAVWPSPLNAWRLKGWQWKQGLKRWLKAKLRPSQPAQGAGES